jgi:hypothetical protein
MKPVKVLAAAITAMTLATPSQALEAYGAVFGDYSLPHAGDASLLGTVLLGVVQPGFQLSFGAEAEYGLAIGSSSDYDTRRLRAVARYNLGTLTAFGAAGLDQFVYSGTTDNAVSVGLGGEFDMQNNMAFRGELIRSFVSSGETENTTTTRLGLVYRF